MTYRKCRFVLFAIAAATLLGPAATYSQTATPSTTVAPVSAPPVAAPESVSAPVPITAAAQATIDRKKALEFGFRPRVVKGAAMFCKDEPIYGSTFKTTRCIAADQIADYLAKLKAALDTMAKNGCSSNGLCGNVGGAPDRSRMGMSSSR
jgi:hypothetical protein